MFWSFKFSLRITSSFLINDFDIEFITYFKHKIQVEQRSPTKIITAYNENVSIRFETFKNSEVLFLVFVKLCKQAWIIVMILPRRLAAFYIMWSQRRVGRTQCSCRKHFVLLRINLLQLPVCLQNKHNVNMFIWRFTVSGTYAIKHHAVYYSEAS